MIGSWRSLTAKTQAMILLVVMGVASRATGEAVWIEEDDTNNFTIRMEVTPADEPSPAFKHRLSLLPHELVPGNSVAHYMRSYPEGGIERTWKHVREKYGEEVDEWYSTDFSISALPLDHMHEAADHFTSLIDDHIGPGSRCRETDWGVSFVDVRGVDVIAFLLPEIQGMRSLGRAVSLRTRLAIAERRYDDALELMRMNYRMGRDVGKQPILVSNLVGIAICGMTNNNVVDLIAAPDSPNLYWALSELSRPQIPMRDSMRLEMQIGPRMFEILDSPETKQHTPAEWNALWMREATFAEDDFSLLTVIDENYDRPPGMKFVPAMMGLVGYSHAKRRLVDWGYAPDDVEAMAVGQVLIIYSARVYQIVANELEKALYIPLPEGKRFADAAWQHEQQMGVFGNHPDREILPIASLLLPAASAARKAGYRIERELDALRVIEALRMHAARNDGQWPQSLDEVTCVPVPENPATNKPFEYLLVGETAVLLLPKSDGFHFERRYELTLAK